MFARSRSKPQWAAIRILLLSGIIGAPAYAEDLADYSPKVQSLLKQLTLDEKLSLTVEARDPLTGMQPGYTRGVPRLNLPPLRWVDGPGGIDGRFETTSLPQPIALAASFNRELAYDYGAVQGRETRATNMDVFLGPMVNLARLPNWGRNATGQGEDPLLNAEITYPQVKGIQDAGTIASVKHYIIYNQNEGVDSDGHQKTGNDFVVDQRTMHEIYLSGFEAGVRGGAGSMMAAYSKVNGLQNADNPDTLQRILRKELGFKGLVESDWGANHSTLSMAHGLDVEFSGLFIGLPRPLYFGEPLKKAIADGQVPAAALDLAVAHVLTAMEGIGVLDHKRPPPPDHIDYARDGEVALKTAEQGAVLLKNDGILPLSGKALGALALIGPTAGQLAANPGFGSAGGIAERKVPPADALRRLPGAQVVFAPGQNLTGEPVPASVLTAEDGGQGLSRIPADGSPITLDPTVDFTGPRALPAGRAFVWKGTLRAPSTGDYVLMAQGWGGSGALSVNGKTVTRFAFAAFGGAPKKTSSLLPTTDDLDNGRGAIRLEAGKTYTIELSAQAWTDQPLQVRLNWTTPEMRRQQVDAAVAAAKAADTAVVFAWQRAGEQGDPEKDLQLPDDQNALIEAVASANPNTVVLLTSGAIQMPWLNKVRAVMEVWFPGQEGGTAIAELLSGKVNPSGKLPITFPAKMADTPARAPGHPERYAGVDGRVVYSEGVFVGYRWYDQNKLEPLFPFGHGLSYTQFRYSGLSAKRSADGVAVSFTLSNTGPRAGAEVAQVYVGPPARSPVPMPPKQLAGFERVELAPGQSKVVTIQIPKRQLSYWSEKDSGWRVAGGERPIYVASSSRDVRLRGSSIVPAK
jgi:beta-glucosidase